jgi:hypothetical protein
MAGPFQASQTFKTSKNKNKFPTKKSVETDTNKKAPAAGTTTTHWKRNKRLPSVSL